jgi:hypothetical protein
MHTTTEIQRVCTEMRLTLCAIELGLARHRLWIPDDNPNPR